MKLIINILIASLSLFTLTSLAKPSFASNSLSLNQEKQVKSQTKKLPSTKSDSSTNYHLSPKLSTIPGLNLPKTPLKPNQAIPDPDMALTFTYDFG